MSIIITVALKSSLSGCTIGLKDETRAWGKTEINGDIHFKIGQ
jgi:hypothetical protein